MVWLDSGGKKAEIPVQAANLYVFRGKISCELNPPPLVEDPERFYRSGEK